MFRSARTALALSPSHFRRAHIASNHERSISSCPRPGMPTDFARNETSPSSLSSSSSSQRMQQSNGAAAVTTDKEHVYHDLGDACKNVHARVDAFLRQDAKSNSRLRQVQRTTRESLGVIEEALERYRCVLPELSSSLRALHI